MATLRWRDFRKSDLAGRRQQLARFLEEGTGTGQSKSGIETRTDLAVPQAEALAFTGPSDSLLEMADVMVENAIGVSPVPLGVAGGFFIDGQERQLPLATEEPSVIAAASFAATIIARHGGFTTWASEPSMAAQIFLQFPSGSDLPILPSLERFEALIRETLAGPLASMEARGGGYQACDLGWLDMAGADRVLRVQVHIDTRDAMGANLLNTCAEALRAPLEGLCGGQVLMAILSNAAAGRLAGASCRIPLAEMGRGKFNGPDLASRIALAARVADCDPGRGVTHNKGIMNGISALALATGNDTRAIEAAAHAWAAREGRYRALSSWWLEGDALCGRLEMPLPFATVGGALGCNPANSLALALAGVRHATDLSRLAAALGLAQNFAALQALCGEGIQAGHMQLHDRRSAWIAARRHP